MNFKHFSLVLLCFTFLACRPTATPQSTVTPSPELPTPTATTRPTLTPKPTITATLTLTSTSNVQPAQGPVFQGDAILLRYILGGEIFLQDIDTGQLRALDRQLVIVNEDGFMGWTRNGCGFYFRMHNGDIVDLNLRGETARKVFSFDSLQPSEGEVHFQSIDLSPSEEWVIYHLSLAEKTEIDGVEVNKYHPVNLMTLSSDGSQGPYQISQRGGGRSYTWSPDSTRIAYSDLDENGIFQVFVINFDGTERKQLTQFTEITGMPNGFGWSPDSRYFSILYEFPEGEFTSLIIDTENVTLLNLGKWTYSWWDRTSTLISWNNDLINWIEPNNGTLVKSVDTPAVVGTFRPYGNLDQLICLGFCLSRESEDYGLYIFDSTNSTITEKSAVERLIDTGGWSVTPPEFPGEAACAP